MQADDDSTQTAGLVLNRITVDNFTFLLSCTMADWTLDSEWPDVVSLVRSTGVHSWKFLLRYSVALYCCVLIFVLSLFLYLALYVLGDDTLISYGSYMRTKHLFS